MGRRIPLTERINFDPVTGCWNWTGALVGNGYGVANYKGIRIMAHRLSAHLWLRMDINDPRCVLHKCDNPKCFNPKHLFLGTTTDNIRDMVSKKRDRYSWRNVCKNGHPFTPDNIRKNAPSGRICLTCCRDSYIRRKERMAREGRSVSGKLWTKGPYKNSFMDSLQFSSPKEDKK